MWRLFSGGLDSRFVVSIPSNAIGYLRSRGISNRHCFAIRPGEINVEVVAAYWCVCVLGDERSPFAGFAHSMLAVSAYVQLVLVLDIR